MSYQNNSVFKLKNTKFLSKVILRLSLNDIITNTGLFVAKIPTKIFFMHVVYIPTSSNHLFSQGIPT